MTDCNRLQQTVTACASLGYYRMLLAVCHYLSSRLIERAVLLMNSSGCCIALPVGRSGSIRSNWCMLTISWATAPMHHIPIGRMYSRGSCISIQTRRRLHHLLLWAQRMATNVLLYIAVFYASLQCNVYWTSNICDYMRIYGLLWQWWIYCALVCATHTHLWSILAFLYMAIYSRVSAKHIR